jgi:hypothetical protein
MGNTRRITNPGLPFSARFVSRKLSVKILKTAQNALEVRAAPCAQHVAQSPVDGRAGPSTSSDIPLNCFVHALPSQSHSKPHPTSQTEIFYRPEPHKRPYSYEDAVPSSARPCACAVLIIKRGPGKCTNNSIPFYLFLALYLLSASPGVSLSLSLSLSLFRSSLSFHSPLSPSWKVEIGQLLIIWSHFPGA